MPAWHSKQMMLAVRVGDTCSASTDGWTIATNSIGYLRRRGAASRASPHARARARGQAQRVARTRFTSLRGTRTQRRAKARARCAAHADRPTWDPRGGRTSPSWTRGGRRWRARPRHQGNATPRRLGCNVQRGPLYTARHAAWRIKRNACNQPRGSTLTSRTCVVVRLHAAWALHHAACVASEAIIRAQTRCPSLHTPALTSHSRVQHCIMITPVVAAAPRAATCNIQDATGML